MRFAAVLRTFAHLSPALLRAAHLGSAAMSHADMAGTASLVPLRPTTIFLRAAHLGFAAMSHADMAGTASLVPIASHYYIPTSDAIRCGAAHLRSS